MKDFNNTVLNLLNKRYQGNISFQENRLGLSHRIKLILKGIFFILVGVLIGITIAIESIASGPAWCIPWDLEAMSTSSYKVPSIALNNGYSVNLEWVELWRSRKELLQLDEILTFIYRDHKDEFNDLIVSIEKHEHEDFVTLMTQLREFEAGLDLIFLRYSIIDLKLINKKNILLLTDMIFDTMQWYRELFQTMDTSILDEGSRVLISDFFKDIPDITEGREMKNNQLSLLHRSFLYLTN